MEGNLLLFGDFNSVIEKEIDKSGRATACSEMAQVFNK